MARARPSRPRRWSDFVADVATHAAKKLYDDLAYTDPDAEERAVALQEQMFRDAETLSGDAWAKKYAPQLAAYADEESPMQNPAPRLEWDEVKNRGVGYIDDNNIVEVVPDDEQRGWWWVRVHAPLVKDSYDLHVQTRQRAIGVAHYILGGNQPADVRAFAPDLWEDPAADDDDQPGENPAPHSGKVLYLAVMPGNRKPKAVPPSSVGFYQARARLFYEAPGMTAVQARAAIKDGTLLPTWQNGQPVTSYSVQGGKVKPKVDKARPLLGDALAAGEGRDVVLRLGRKLYTAQWSFRPHTQGGGRYRSWHEHSLSGFTYAQEPIGYRETQAALRKGEDWEVAYISEDYTGGVAMGALVALAQAGESLKRAGDPDVLRMTRDFMGRKFGVRKVIGPYRLTAADLDSLSRA